MLALMVVADLTLELPLPRGILVVLAAAIKVTPVILIVYLFLTRQCPSGARAVRVLRRGPAVRRRSQLVHLVAGLLDARHPRPAAGGGTWRGSATRDCSACSSACWATPLTTTTTFVLVVTVGAVGLVVAAGAYRLPAGAWGSSSSRPPSPSPAPFLVAPLHLGAPVGGLAGAGPGPAARPSGTPSGLPCSFGPLGTRWAPHGPDVAFAGRGWLIPLSEWSVAVRCPRGRGGIVVVRSTVERHRRGPAAGDGAVGRRHLTGPPRRVLTRVGADRARTPGRAGVTRGRACPPPRTPCGLPSNWSRPSASRDPRGGAPRASAPRGRSGTCWWPAGGLAAGQDGATQEGAHQHAGGSGPACRFWQTDAVASRVRDASTLSQTKSEGAAGSWPALSSAPPRSPLMRSTPA